MQYFLILIFIIFIIVLLMKSADTPADKKLIDVKAYEKKFILTKKEGIFFRNLYILLGQKYIIFAQVPFSCIVRPKDRANRGLFWKINQKRVDFVLLDKNLNTICIIELDDKSHTNKSAIDKNRDDLFAHCHIPTYRFNADHEINYESMRKKLSDVGLITSH